MIRVVVSPDPFGSMLAQADLPHGQSLAEIIAAIVPGTTISFRLVVMVDGERISADRWRSVVPDDGSIIAINVLPAGANGGRIGLQVVSALLALAAVASAAIPGGQAATPYLAAAAIATSTAATFAFPVPTPKFYTAEDEFAVYRVGPARNDARAWGRVPMLFGRMRFTPPAAARAYTQLSGDVDYWQVILALSGGLVRVDEVYVGNVPYRQLGSDIQVELRRGWHPSQITDKGVWSTVGAGFFPDVVAPEAGDHYTAEAAGTVAGRAVHIGDTVTFNGLADANQWEAWDLNQFRAMALYAKAIAQLNPAAELSTNVIFTRTTPANTTWISVEITFPWGLYHIQNSPPGKISAREANFILQVAPAGSNSWAIVRVWRVSDKRTVTFSTGHSFGVAAGAWDVRLWRTDYQAHDDARNFDKAVWTDVKSYTQDDAVPLNTGIAYLALRGRRNANTDTIEVLATAMFKAPSDTPGTWKLVPTRSLAAAFRGILQHPASPNILEDDEIDIQRLEDWHNWAATQSQGAGWNYDAYIDGEHDLEEALIELCKCGRASPGFRDGLRSVVIDRVQGAPVQVITPLNSWAYRCEFAYPEQVHGYRSSFADAEQGYRIDDSRVVYADGFDADTATDVRRLDWVGVTDWAQIFALTRYHLAQQYFRRETHIVSQDWESLVCERGSRVRLAHDVLKVGLGGGRIVSLTVEGGYATTVTLDASVRLDPAVTAWGMLVRQARGAIISAVVYPVTPVGPGPGADTWTFNTPPAALSDATVIERFEFSGTVYGTWYGTPPASSASVAFDAAGLVLSAACSVSWLVPGDAPLYFRAELVWLPANVSDEHDLLRLAVAGPARLKIAYDGASGAFIVVDEADQSVATLTFPPLVADEPVSVILAQTGNNLILSADNGILTRDVTVVRAPIGEITSLLVPTSGLARGTLDTLLIADLGKPLADATVPIIGELAVIGERDRESLDLMVAAISPSGSHGAELRLIPYADGLYSADTEAAPVFDPVSRLNTLPPPEVLEVISGNQIMEVTPTGALLARVLFRMGSSLVPDAQLTVLLRLSGSTQAWGRAAVLMSTPGQAIIGGVSEGDTYDFVLFYTHPDYRPSPESKIYGHRVLGRFDTPRAVDGLTISVAGGTATLRWARSTDADVLRGGYLQVRHSSVTVDAEATNSYTLGATLPPDATMTHVPAFAGTYFVVAVDSTGRFGEPASIVLSKTVSPLAWAALDDGIEDPGFTGDKTNLTAGGGLLKLAAVDDIVAGSGTYLFHDVIDLGAVKRARLRLDLNFAITEESDDWDDQTAWDSPSESWDGGVAGITGCDVVAYARFTDDDPTASPTWGPWMRFDLTEFEARAIDMKLEFTSEGNTLNVAVNRLRAYVEEIV